MRDTPPLHNVSLWMFTMWLVILAIVFIPPSDPPSAPAGVGIVRGFPIHAVPAGAVTLPIVEVPNDVPLSFEERFSHDAIGPDGAWAEAACLGLIPSAHCPVSRSAVTEQGVGE